MIVAMETDETPQMWLVAAQTLGKFGAQASEAIPALTKWFEHPKMRDVAIEALGEIGPSAESTMERIASVANTAHERFISRSKAIDALVSIGGPEHPLVRDALALSANEADGAFNQTVRESIQFYRRELVME